MNSFFFSTFFVIALFFKGYDCAEDVEPQVKITRALPLFMNPIYVNPMTFDYNITKANATYNNLGLNWQVTRDLPANTRLVSRIYTTDADGNNPKLLTVDETPICVESKNRELLPKLLVVDASELDGKCIKKGTYEFEDMGQFRFEHLIKDLPSKGTYYKVIYTLIASIIPIQSSVFYSEWGYLNN